MSRRKTARPPGHFPCWSSFQNYATLVDAAKAERKVVWYMNALVAVHQITNWKLSGGDVRYYQTVLFIGSKRRTYAVECNPEGGSRYVAYEVTGGFETQHDIQLNIQACLRDTSDGLKTMNLAARAQRPSQLLQGVVL